VLNTRFEAVSGKIYRIDQDIVVPGQKTIDGKLVPGSIKSTVYANDPGESYNSEATDFTIPGFKGSDRYAGFSAKSDGPITGGLVGKEQSVDATTLESTTAELKVELEKALIQSVGSQIPKDFVLLDGGSSVSYRILPTVAEGANAKITIEGTLSAKVFKRADLESVFSTESRVSILSYDGLRITVDQSAPVDTSTGDSISFRAEGDVKAVASVDTSKLLENVKGKPRKNILAILASYPEIESAKIAISPPWIMKVPENTEDIKIINSSTELTKSE